MPLNIDLNTPLNELNTLPLNIDLNIPFNSSTNLYPLEEEDDIGIEFEANLSQEEEEEEDIFGFFDNNIDNRGNMVTGFISIPKSKVGASISILDFILVGYFEELD
jgi:hypothetical protein